MKLEQLRADVERGYSQCLIRPARNVFFRFRECPTRHISEVPRQECLACALTAAYLACGGSISEYDSHIRMGTIIADWARQHYDLTRADLEWFLNGFDGYYIDCFQDGDQRLLYDLGRELARRYLGN